MRIVFNAKIVRMSVSAVVLLLLIMFGLCSCMQGIANYDLADICEIMERTIGNNRDEVERMLEKHFDSDLEICDMKVDDETNVYTYRYNISEKIYVDGVLIDSIYLECGDNDEIVDSLVLFFKCTDSTENKTYYLNVCRYLNETCSFIESIDLGDDFQINRYQANDFYLFTASFVNDSSSSGFWLKCSSNDE